MINVSSFLEASDTIPQMHILNSAVNSNNTIFHMNEYFEGQIFSNTIMSSFEAYPICTLSGRVKVDPNTGSESFRAFVGKNEVEMSEKEDQIAEFVENVINANYTTELLSDEELPYLALAAFYKGLLSIWETSDVLFWHQRRKDFADNEPRVLPLLDKDNNWKNEGKEFLYQRIAYVGGTYIKFNSKANEELLDLIRKLPRSQQVWLKFERPPQFLNTIDRTTTLSSEAFGAFLRVETGRQFKVQPRIGPFLKEEIINDFMGKRIRSINTFWPNLIINPSLGLNEVTLSKFSGHDWTHRLLMHIYSSELVDLLQELLISFKSITNEPISKEMWAVADFDYLNFQTRLIKPISFDKIFSKIFYGTELESELEKLDIHEEFKLLMQNEHLNFQNSLWSWHLMLFLNSKKEHLLSKYNLQVDNIPNFSKLNKLLTWAEPFLKDCSVLERIYLLQKFVDSNRNWHGQLFGNQFVRWFQENIHKLEKIDVEIFFKDQSKITPLKIKRNKFENKITLTVVEAV